MNQYIKLKDNINLNKLAQYGFIEDPTNCEHPEDHYYHLNNWFCQINNEFRITVNTNNRHIDILCYVEETGLFNIFNLKPLYNLIKDNMVESI